MALRAGFVGINRHADPRVSDLTGAVADATALWALFSDSIDGLDAARCTNEEASLCGIRGLLDHVRPSDPRTGQLGGLSRPLAVQRCGFPGT